MGVRRLSVGITVRCQRTVIALAVASALATFDACGREKLDLSFIQGGATLSKEAWNALNGNYAPGRYLIDLSLNGKDIGKQILDVTPQESERLCLSDKWLKKAGVFVSPDYFKNGYDTTRQCYILNDAPAVTVDFDVATQKLSLAIPQRGLLKTADNIDWDYGTSAFRINYNANANTGRYSTSAFGSADLKANVGRWVISSTTTANSSNNGENDASVDMFTATRAIRSLSADLSAGKTQTGDNILGSTGTFGISLTRNNSMKPGNLGYTPEFTGIANSPSRVTLRQGGRMLYSEMVPTGPFTISDVPLYTSGDVIMTITSEDGRESTQVFPLSVISGQLNPGQHEFNISGGVPDDDSYMKGGIFSASYGYGFNGLTLRAGGILNADYQGINASVVTGLGSLGAISTEIAHSNAEYEKQPSRSGEKVGLSWNKLLEITNTNLRMSWSRQDAGFESMSSFDPSEKSQLRYRIKDEWNAGISQPVGGLFSLSVSGWMRNYYDDQYINTSSKYFNYYGRDTGVTGSLSTQINGVSLSVVGSGSRNTSGYKNWAVSASVSIPFTLFDRRYSSSTSVSSNKDGGAGFSSGISGSLNDRFSYGFGAGRDSSGSTTSYLNSSYSGDRAYMSGSLNHSSSAGTSGSVSVTGSVLAVPAAGDVILSRTTGETVAVVNVKDTPGVKVLSGNGETNNAGNLVVPLNSYDWNTVTIDAGSLPLDTELTGTSHKFVPTEKAVIWLPFESLKIKRYLLQIRMPDGSFVPGGTWARDSNNTPLGFVANNGVLMINAVEDLGDITLGKCRIPAEKMKETEKLQEIMCD
ncbi:PefC/AfrB family outer membrane usher protein [Escherichia coli]